MSNSTQWQDCLSKLSTVVSTDEIETWLLPLHAVIKDQQLILLAPNRYVLGYIQRNLLDDIEKVAAELAINAVSVEIGSHVKTPAAVVAHKTPDKELSKPSVQPYTGGKINKDYKFESHVAGVSNQLARAAAIKVGESPGNVYNPLFIYGGVGLGKTHLMQAAGNMILERQPDAKVVYVRSELFVNDMIKAISNNTMNEFKRYYRSLDALLIDDIQFFAKKTQSQEEFFHTFNSLLEGERQIIMTSDTIPKAITNVEERLISRFGSGLTVPVEPPELETRIAILQRKANLHGINLNEDVAYFVANIIRSNVRELEGALHRILASASFTKRPIDIPLVRDCLQDLLSYQEKQISIDNIQQTIAEYYKIRVADLLSKKRSRNIARPRQMAMYFAKELTNLSLPQIGDKFGGRDHTTVLHACRKIDELLTQEQNLVEDKRNLQDIFGV